MREPNDNSFHLYQDGVSLGWVLEVYQIIDEEGEWHRIGVFGTKKAATEARQGWMRHDRVY